MADNVNITPGVGASVATDEVNTGSGSAFYDSEGAALPDS